MATSNIVTAKVSIVGTRPMFQHKFGPDAMPLEKQERTGVAGHDPEEWRKTCLVNKEGQLYVPGTYIFATVREGSKQIKKGRGSIMPLVQATLQVVDDKVLIDRFYPGFPNGHGFDAKTVEPPPEDDTLPVYLDIRGVRNPSTKARNVRYRICAAAGWRCSFSLLWDKTVVSRSEMESAVWNAGKLSGLGNGRAIGMGRFDIESFEVQE